MWGDESFPHDQVMTHSRQSTIAPEARNAALERLLTPAETAAVLRVQPRTLEFWRRRRAARPRLVRCGYDSDLQVWLRIRTVSC